jgi:hypothetical protein
MQILIIQVPAYLSISVLYLDLTSCCIGREIIRLSLLIKYQEEIIDLLYFDQILSIFYDCSQKFNFFPVSYESGVFFLIEKYNRVIKTIFFFSKKIILNFNEDKIRKSNLIEER